MCRRLFLFFVCFFTLVRVVRCLLLSSTKFFYIVLCVGLLFARWFLGCWLVLKICFEMCRLSSLCFFFTVVHRVLFSCRYKYTTGRQLERAREQEKGGPELSDKDFDAFSALLRGLTNRCEQMEGGGGYLRFFPRRKNQKRPSGVQRSNRKNCVESSTNGTLYSHYSRSDVVELLVFTTLFRHT